MKIIGLITAWGAEKWIEPSIKQALAYCDEVIVNIGYQTKSLAKFKDKTYQLAEKYKDKVILLNINKTKEISSRERCKILNTMLSKSKYFKVGNWVWLLDVDEFYTEDMVKEIKKTIKTNKYNIVKVKEYFFYINMQHYLLLNHLRLFKINNKKDHFKPTNKWATNIKKKIYTTKNRMFHFALLTGTGIRETRWKTENKYAHTKKIDWLNKIYKNYNLNNEDYWINKNKESFGIKSPHYNPACKPNKDKKLFKYKGKYPRYIEETNLKEVKDFRNI